MTIYSARFETDTHSAEDEIEAATPEEALEKARALFNTDPGSLWWESLEIGDVQLIIIDDDKSEHCPTWASEKFCLRLYAPELLEALETLGQAIEKGDLQTIADVWLGQCRRAIDQAKGRE